MSIGKLITKDCDNMPIEKHVAFNSDGSIVIGTCAEDAQKYAPERTCKPTPLSKFELYTCRANGRCECGELIFMGNRYCPKCGAKVVN